MSPTIFYFSNTITYSHYFNIRHKYGLITTPVIVQRL